MKEKNPRVTLADEARIGVKEEVRSGFLDWLFQTSLTGDDGEIYALGGSILSLHQEKLDVVSINLAKGQGSTRQLPGSIYRLGTYPGLQFQRLYQNPQGTLKITKKEHSVLVECGKEYTVECFEDNRWHIMLDSQDGEYKADLWHKPYGFPLWYGRDTPSRLTQHSLTYGYNWSGEVEGEFTFKGENVHVKGSGIRERYVAVDSSAAELGAWEDWGYFDFNEIHTSFYDMRAGMKDQSVYDIEKQQYYPEGNLEITHEDWFFLRELDGFLPETYNIRITTEGGVLEIRSKVANIHTWGVTYKVPDNPVGTLIFDKAEGTFTAKDGTVRKLSGGKGALSVRQWHAYPSILPRELYSDEVLTGEKFETL